MLHVLILLCLLTRISATDTSATSEPAADIQYPDITYVNKDFIILEKYDLETSDVKVAGTLYRLEADEHLSHIVANVAVKSSTETDIAYCFHSDHEYVALETSNDGGNLKIWNSVIKATPLLLEAYYSNQGVFCGLHNEFGLHRFYLLPNEGASLTEGISTLHNLNNVIKRYASKQPHVLWVLGTALTVTVAVLIIIPIVVYKCRRARK